MIESLTDQWIRAGSLLVQTSGYFLALALARIEALNETLGRPRTDPRMRDDLDARLRDLEIARTQLMLAEQIDTVIAEKEGRPFVADHEDPALVRALRAETGVRLRWGVTEGATYRAPTTDDVDEREVHHEGAIGDWAASAIERKSLTVPALEAKPTLVQLADWMERFSKALLLALARVEMARVPARLVTGILDTRAGRVGRMERAPRVPGVFALGELERWRFVPPKGYPLTLPFGGTGKAGKGSVIARAVLTGAVLRAYLATWSLLEESELGDGRFEVDVPHVIRDLYGVPMYREPKRGILRPPPAHERTFKAAFNTLQSIQLEGIGDVTLGDPKLGRQPQFLITCMNDPKGKTYHHAPIAMLARENFVQVPQAVLRLKADDTALALGIANVWHRRVGAALRVGHYRATLQQLADAVGEDAFQKTRDRGAPAYFRALADRLPRVMREGQLGDLHLEGEGPSAVATLTPSDALATVYQTFAKPRSPLALEVEASAKPSRKRRPGRPRRDI